MTARRIAWAVWVASLALTGIWMVLKALGKGLDPFEAAFIAGGILLYATVGALITSRQPDNRVGLLFAWVGLWAAVGIVTGAYAELAQLRDLAGLAAATWVSRTSFVVMFCPVAFLFLIFPTGHPPSRRWGWLLRVMLVASAVAVVGFAFTPGSMNAGFAELPIPVMNPLGLPFAWKQAIETVTSVAGLVLLLGALVSLISLVQLYRRAETVQRQQIRLLGVVGLFIAAFVVVFFPLFALEVVSDEGLLSTVTFFVFITGVFIGIPLACGVAILRHGLWDLDVVVKKTVQYGVLVAATIAVAGVLLFMLPVMFVGLDRDLLPGVVVGVVLAVAIALLRHPARRLADRIVYGGRATPYEVLSEFAGHLGETYSTEDVLPRMAQILGDATRARTARVWLRVGRDLVPAAGWPADAPARAPLRVSGDHLPAIDGEAAFEVRDGGALLGALSVEPTASDPMTPSKERLVHDLAGQARLVLRNVRLIEELRASRQRLVAAQDEERRRLERNIHDGAQQQLVALQVKQRLAASILDRDPAKAGELLGQLQTETATALEDLRDLARGIYPPLLADQGLASALESQARKASIPVMVEPDGIGRYPQEVEAAVYFSCLEALQNVAKYGEADRATVTLAHADGELTFSVSDDGRGFDPDAASRGSGLQGIADRLAALGGTLDVRSAPGHGTTVAGRLPVETAP